jgi:hypothetical protein
MSAESKNSIAVSEKKSHPGTESNFHSFIIIEMWAKRFCTYRQQIPEIGVPIIRKFLMQILKLLFGLLDALAKHSANVRSQTAQYTY